MSLFLIMFHEVVHSQAYRTRAKIVLSLDQPQGHEPMIRTGSHILNIFMILSIYHYTEYSQLPLQSFRHLELQNCPLFKISDTEVIFAP